MRCNQSEVGEKSHQRGGKLWNQNRHCVGDKRRDVANMQSVSAKRGESERCEERQGVF